MDQYSHVMFRGLSENIPLHPEIEYQLYSNLSQAIYAIDRSCFLFLWFLLLPRLPCGHSVRGLGRHLGIMTSCPLITADWTRAEHLTQAGPADSFSRACEIGTKRVQASVWLLSCQDGHKNLETVGNSHSLLHGLGNRESQYATTGEKNEIRGMKVKRKRKDS